MTLDSARYVLRKYPGLFTHPFDAPERDEFRRELFLGFFTHLSYADFDSEGLIKAIMLILREEDEASCN